MIKRMRLFICAIILVISMRSGSSFKDEKTRKRHIQKRSRTRFKYSKRTRNYTSLTAAPLPKCTYSLSPKRFERTNFLPIGDPQCTIKPCVNHAFCFLGLCVCHPGYYMSDQAVCVKFSNVSESNPWFTANCPNLHTKSPNQLTYDISTPLSDIGGEYNSGTYSTVYQPSPLFGNIPPSPGCINTPLPYCAYLCYAHKDYGTAVVPMSLWNAAQREEAALWQTVGGVGCDARTCHDRADEHWEAFDMYKVLVRKGYTNLGNTIEVGAGPWTQLKVNFISCRLMADNFEIKPLYTKI